MSEEALHRMLKCMPSQREPGLRKLVEVSSLVADLVALRDQWAEVASGGAPRLAAAPTDPKERTQSPRATLEKFRKAAEDTEATKDIAAWPAILEAATFVEDACRQDGEVEAASAKATFDTDAAALMQSIEQCSWRNGLPKEGAVSWTHVAREMDYRFWKATPPPLDTMNLAYDKAQKSWTTYEGVCKSQGAGCDEATKKQWDTTKQTAELLNTEEYFCRHLADTESSTRSSKIRKRITQILHLFEYEEVHPVIRGAIKELIGM